MTSQPDRVEGEAPAAETAETPESAATYVVVSPDDPDSLERAAAAVRAGECIVVPTDTVYGIGADAFSSAAVQRLLDAKRRGSDMPPPVLIAEPGMLRALGRTVPSAASELAKAFWPGALTLILNAQRTLNLKIGETGGTVAVRVPAHDATRNLLRRTGPLAVSSANVSGQPAATSVAAAISDLGESVSVYVDGGESPGGTASTIVDFTSTPTGVVLRQGAITFEALQEVVPQLKPFAAPTPAETAPEQQQEAATGAQAAAGVEDARDESPREPDPAEAAPGAARPETPEG